MPRPFRGGRCDSGTQHQPERDQEGPGPQRATKRALRRELGSARQVRKHLKTWRREQIEAPEAL